MRRQAAGAVAAVLLLAGCSGDGPNGSGGPSPTPAASFTEVGDGNVLGSDWTYGVAPDGDEWCTRLEVGDASTSRCGDLLPAGDEIFGSLGSGPDAYREAQAIEGFVAEEVATVWLIGEDQYRIPAVLVPLDDVGVDGAQAFVGFAEADARLTHLQAVKLNGDIVDTLELP